MKIKILACFAATIMAFTVANASASAILTQTNQGQWAVGLGSSSFSTLTSMLEEKHTISQTPDFSDINILENYEAIWVSVEAGNTLSTSEVTALNTYLNNGGKAVLVGENFFVNSWNASLMNVVGGSFTSACSDAVGNPITAHALTQNINSIQGTCGSLINSTPESTLLFSNNLAGLYKIGSGEALVLMDINWAGDPFGDKPFINNLDNRQFAENIVDWLSPATVSTEVPEPTSLALFGLGFLTFGLMRRRKPKIYSANFQH